MDIDFDKIELMDGSKHTEQVKRTISINLLGNLFSIGFLVFHRPRILTYGAPWRDRKTMVLTEKQHLINACDYSEFNALIKVMRLQGFRIPYSA